MYSQCDRCKGFATQKPCTLQDDHQKCDECTQAKQGCFWDGIGRTGIRRRAETKKPVPARAKSFRKVTEVVEIDSEHGEGSWAIDYEFEWTLNRLYSACVRQGASSSCVGVASKAEAVPRCEGQG